jgi:hypothetical protein
MIKTEGKVYTEVVKLLRAEGVEPVKIAVATLGRGCDHLILRDGDTIGEYNHKSKKIVLYKDKN